jgi:membrane-anchored glycerophosphoryl diester phosphodiesterase (GDPDase)
MKEISIIFILPNMIYQKLKISKNYHQGILILLIKILMVNFIIYLDLNYNTQKTYQKYYYSTKPMKSVFKLSIQNNKEGRKFYIPPRP